MNRNGKILCQLGCASIYGGIMKIIKKIFLILLVILSTSPVWSDAVIDTFIRVNLAGRLTATIQTSDKGYVSTSKISQTKFLVTKVNASGRKQWERTLNFKIGQSNTLAFIKGIAQTSDGGFILAGEVATNCDYLPFDCGPIAASLVKLRPNGTTAWKKSLRAYDGYFFTSVIAMPDTGFIAVGGLRDVYGYQTENQLIAIRFTATGDTLWEKSFKASGGISWDTQNKLQDLPLISSKPTSDNGFIAAFPSTDGIDVFKITESGNLEWKNLLTMGGFVYQSLGVTAAGEAIVVGTTTHSTKLAFVILKADGSLKWKSEYSIKLPGAIQSISSPIETADQGLAITGNGHVDARGIYDYAFISKIDSSRKIVFQNLIGQTYENGPEIGTSIFATEAGGFTVFGSGRVHRLGDVFILKLNSEGTVSGCESFYSVQFGSTSNASFEPFTISNAHVVISNQLAANPFDFRIEFCCYRPFHYNCLSIIISLLEFSQAYLADNVRTTRDIVRNDL